MCFNKNSGRCLFMTGWDGLNHGYWQQIYVFLADLRHDLLTNFILDVTESESCFIQDLLFCPRVCCIKAWTI